MEKNNYNWNDNIYSSAELLAVKKDQKRRIKEAHARLGSKWDWKQITVRLIIASFIVLLAFFLQDLITHWAIIIKYNLL